MFWYGNGMNVWGYGLMTVSMVLFWGLVLYGAIAVVRYLAREDRSAPTVRPTPEQLLGERFAHGAIDEQEYRQRLEALRGGSLTKP